MNIQEKYDYWNLQLQEEYQKIFQTKVYISDGVVNPEQYANSPIKIMFLNREPNATDEDYDLPQAIRTDIENHKKVLNSSIIFRQSCAYDLALGRCLISPNFLTLSLEDFNKIAKPLFDDDEFNRSIIKTAICNVKKVGGTGKIRNWDEIREHYDTGKEILFKQIKYYNPSLIICGNLIENVLDYCSSRFEWNQKIWITSDNSYKKFCIWIMNLDGQEYPILDLYHPSSLLLRDNPEYWYEVLKGMQQIERKNPGFWASHMNQPCFEE